MVVKEAMACDRPLVSTDVGDVRDLCAGVRGCFICSHDPEDMAAKIAAAMTLDGSQPGGRARIVERRALGAGGRRAVHRALPGDRRLFDAYGVNRPARICVIRHGYFPDDPRVRREVGALLDEGYEVDVLCLRGAGEPRVERWRSARIHRLPGRHVRRGPLRYVWEYTSFFVLASLKVTSLHIRKRFDVVQVHTLPDALVFAALVPKLMGAKVILDMHELMPEFAATKFRVSSSSLLVRATARFEGWSARFADRALGVSTAQTSIIEPRVGRKLLWCPTSRTRRSSPMRRIRQARGCSGGDHARDDDRELRSPTLDRGAALGAPRAPTGGAHRRRRGVPSPAETPCG